MKILKLSDVANKTLDSIDDTRDSIEKYATILTCLVEFNSIENALSFHHEIDKTKINLI